MERLIRHIENLLIHNDYVIIPGLGGFVLQEQQAQITPEGIVPPHHRVGFNVRMDNNDGLLATEVLRAEGIPYRAALALIRDEVTKARKALQAGDDVQLGMLGTLKLNQEKQITYTPADMLPVIPGDFGLGTLHVARLRSKQAPQSRSHPPALTPQRVPICGIHPCISGCVALRSPHGRRHLAQRGRHRQSLGTV